MTHQQQHQAFHDFCAHADNWKCPQCGRGYIDDNGLLNDSSSCDVTGCELTHEEDEAYCEHCGWQGTAKNIADAATARSNTITCPHCAGSGRVTKGATDATNT